MLAALDRLLFAGIVPARDRDDLADAYLFLRRAEHRVQMVDGRQTHRLPPPEERLPPGPGHGRTPRVEEFEAALSGHRERVAALFAGLLGTGGERLPPSTPSWPCWPTSRSSRSAGGRSRCAAASAIPTSAVAAIDAMARPRHPLLAHGRSGRGGGAAHRRAGATPDPDQALSHLADFAAALRSPEPYFQLLGERRRVARLLLSLFGTSDFLSKRFLRHPELIDALLRADQVELEKEPPALRDELDERLAARAAARGSTTAGAAARRAAPLQERGGAAHRPPRHRRHASGSRQRGRASSPTWPRPAGALPGAGRGGGRGQGLQPPGAALRHRHGEAGRPRARLPLRPRPHLPLPGPAGGRTPGQSAPYARLAQRFMAFLQMPLREGRLYQIDTRLRPSGNQGALVTAPTASPATTSARGAGRQPARSAASSGSDRRSCGPASWPATRRSSNGSTSK